MTIIQRDLKQTAFIGFRIYCVLEMLFVGEFFNDRKGSIFLIFEMFRVDTKSSEAKCPQSGFFVGTVRPYSFPI